MELVELVIRQSRIPTLQIGRGVSDMIPTHVNVCGTASKMKHTMKCPIYKGRNCSADHEACGTGCQELGCQTNQIQDKVGLMHEWLLSYDP
jgi:hypothetical protein